MSKINLTPFHERGVVLVVVLWIIALLSLAAASYGKSTRTEILLTAQQVQAAQSRGLAEAGVWLAVHELLARNPRDSGTQPQQTIAQSFGGGEISVQIRDAASKIDLNAAQPELLLGLLASAGADGEQAGVVVDSILDWRDRDNLRRDRGAEDAEYRALGRPYGAKDGPFNGIEELRLVNGMTEHLYRQLRPALTVYSHRSGLHGETATLEALLAVPGTTSEEVEEYVQQREEAESAGDKAGLAAMDRRYVSGRRSNTYVIMSEGKAADSSFTIEAIMQIRTGPDLPYLILSWREAVMDKRAASPQG